MASLKMVLESALSQLGIKGADPSTCRLLLKDKPLDLSLPVRFANIPAGSKLVLLTVYVYHRSAEASDSADRDEEELPDDFYEFTEADLHRVLAAQATSRVREAASAVLKTKELRAREAREREAAQAARTTHIIVEFPDGYCLQTAFLGGDRLTTLHSLVKRALLPGLAEQFSLFLTPPRVVLQSRQGEATLASAGLVPAARVHVSLPDGPGAGADTLASRYLRPDVLALAQQTPPPSPFHRETGRAGDGAHASGGADESALTAHADTTSRASNVRAATAPHKASGKGPKWLKLGRP